MLIIWVKFNRRWQESIKNCLKLIILKLVILLARCDLEHVCLGLFRKKNNWNNLTVVCSVATFIPDWLKLKYWYILIDWLKYFHSDTVSRQQSNQPQFSCERLGIRNGKLNVFLYLLFCAIRRNAVHKAYVYIYIRSAYIYMSFHEKTH